MHVRLAALVISLLAFAAPAQAAVVRVDFVAPPPNPKFPEPAYETVRYVAAAGETNTVTVSAGPGREVVFADATAPLTPGTGCSAGAGGTVVCLRSGMTPYSGVDVRAGDGDDRVSLSTPANVFGEAGADVLETTAGAGLDGGDGDDTLTGGPEKDSLTGGAGADRLAGGAEADTLNGDRGIEFGAADVTGDDVLDGGEGVDLLTMPRTRDVTVDLAAGTAGGPGERDALTGIERVFTGDGDDRVVGGEGPEEFMTGPGDDEVDGRGGNDVIDGGSGTNVLDGGAGDDLLRFTARSCGAGADVLEGSAIPLAPADCEAIGVDGWMTDIGMTVTRAPVRFGRRGVRFAAGCPATSEAARCGLRLSVRTARGTVIARSPRTLRVARGATGVAHLRITAAGRRILRARKVTVRVLDGDRDDGWRATYLTAR